MRFVPLNCLREGMVSGKSLYGKSGELLLNTGATVYLPYIDKIRELGYNGIYIEDKLSEDIEITEVINDTIRQKTINAVKNSFITLGNGNDISSKNMEGIQNLINEIAEKIYSDRNLIVNMIDLKIFDDYTYFHSVNVGVLAMLIGAVMNLNKNQLYNLGMASILHDIGKVFIPKDILNKPGKLSKDEFKIMKTHSYEGYKYLKERFDLPASVYVGILDHHERYDGRGYPNEKNGKEMTLFGKLIAIAEVYDAFISDRPYRKSVAPSDAVEFIMGGGGSHFDPEIVKAFLQKIAPYPTGTLVKLSNNTIGIVVKNYPDCCLRPRVKIIKHGEDNVENYVIDLRNDMDTLGITIIGIVEDLIL